MNESSGEKESNYYCSNRLIVARGLRVGQGIERQHEGIWGTMKEFFCIWIIEVMVPQFYAFI
jgi:hypothetical protein